MSAICYLNKSAFKIHMKCPLLNKAAAMQLITRLQKSQFVLKVINSSKKNSNDSKGLLLLLATGI